MIDNDLPDPAIIDLDAPLPRMGDVVQAVRSSHTLVIQGGTTDRAFDLLDVAPAVREARELVLSPRGPVLNIGPALRDSDVKVFVARNGVPGRGEQDLSGLHIEEFEGTPTPTIRSILGSPTLRQVTLLNAGRTRLPPLGPNVTSVITWESPALHALPTLANPGSLRHLIIRPTSRFDLRSLEPCVNLEDAAFLAVRNLESLHALAALRSLRRLFIDECGSQDDWTHLLSSRATDVRILEGPRLADDFLGEARRRGWTVDLRDGRHPKEEGTIHAGSGFDIVTSTDGTWSVILRDFGTIEDAMAGSFDADVNGHTVLAALRTWFASTVPAVARSANFDAEADELVVTSPTERDARALMDSAATLLADRVMLTRLMANASSAVYDENDGRG
ncbi:hypothetical protein [Agromyces sp. C10]|uniref:hypothetical protein n=1 Tax=Agromyces sp. C10 TaxID=2935077 RepID=UPI00200A75C5|nr:hypothetical protein [Agromyces sp. C10]MCK8609455.1 hypothetical protein [Agromyces sp. C10]